MKIFFTSLSFYFISATVFSQTAELFDAKNSKLVDDDLWEVTIDNDGKLYLGTIKFGLITYENGEFKNLNKNNSIIKGDAVTPIFKDSKGNIWLNYSKPNDEIAKFDGINCTIYSTKEIPTTEISVIDFAEDKEGNIYFGGENGIFKFNGISWSKVDVPVKTITVRAMDINENGDIAIGHNDGLLIYTNGKWQILDEENSELQLSVVRAVKYIDNKLYIGYGGGFGNGGLSILENDKWRHFNKKNSKIPDHMVRDIEVDKNGTIWMATNNGMIKMIGNEIEPIFFRKGMYMNVIMDIATQDNIIWVATNFGLIKITL